MKITLRFEVEVVLNDITADDTTDLEERVRMQEIILDGWGYPSENRVKVDVKLLEKKVA